MISLFRCLRRTFGWLGKQKKLLCCFVNFWILHCGILISCTYFSGLLSAHVLAEFVRKREQSNHFKWYRGELLEMAKDLGFRLLPAFNTTTGIPHARINLRNGMKSDELRNSRETCTACAGSLLLEFAALSRLSGEPIFEAKAHAAMDALWKIRNRGSDLMGELLLQFRNSLYLFVP